MDRLARMVLANFVFSSYGKAPFLITGKLGDGNLEGDGEDFSYKVNDKSFLIKRDDGKAKIESTTATDSNKLYSLLKKNPHVLNTVKFEEVRGLLDKAGIKSLATPREDSPKELKKAAQFLVKELNTMAPRAVQRISEILGVPMKLSYIQIKDGAFSNEIIQRFISLEPIDYEYVEVVTKITVDYKGEIELRDGDVIYKREHHGYLDRGGGSTFHLESVRDWLSVWEKKLHIGNDSVVFRGGKTPDPRGHKRKELGEELSARKKELEDFLAELSVIKRLSTLEVDTESMSSLTFAEDTLKAVQFALAKASWLDRRLDDYGSKLNVQMNTLRSERR
jgi:hypothetical protein